MEVASMSLGCPYCHEDITPIPQRGALWKCGECGDVFSVVVSA